MSDEIDFDDLDFGEPEQIEMGAQCWARDKGCKFYSPLTYYKKEHGVHLVIDDAAREVLLYDEVTTTNPHHTEQVEDVEPGQEIEFDADVWARVGGSLEWIKCTYLFDKNDSSWCWILGAPCLVSEVTTVDPHTPEQVEEEPWADDLPPNSEVWLYSKKDKYFKNLVGGGCSIVAIQIDPELSNGFLYQLKSGKYQVASCYPLWCDEKLSTCSVVRGRDNAYKATLIGCVMQKSNGEV
ncbi:MAG: hypothetical protein HRT63_12740 [Erythrobacter sp.]|nr:hypothetical protein [Erythrobacter sp.]